MTIHLSKKPNPNYRIKSNEEIERMLEIYIECLSSKKTFEKPLIDARCLDTKIRLYDLN
ncbi:hypothetical protein HOE04_01015 [archaeon]|jgi:hypothetical protein|nr:hypothetical protein [archaeon]